MTKVELDLILDIDMLPFFQNSIRGDVSYVSKKYSKANNKLLTSSDAKKQTKYIMNLDNNNLNGYTMSRFSPTG